MIAGLVKALQALNQTSWQDAFLGLWTAALRLVQRVRAYSEYMKHIISPWYNLKFRKSCRCFSA